jgi:hypothetical protein
MQGIQTSWRSRDCQNSYHQNRSNKVTGSKIESSWEYGEMENRERRPGLQFFMFVFLCGCDLLVASQYHGCHFCPYSFVSIVSSFLLVLSVVPPSWF